MDNGLRDDRRVALYGDTDILSIGLLRVPACPLDRSPVCPFVRLPVRSISHSSSARPLVVRQLARLSDCPLIHQHTRTSSCPHARLLVRISVMKGTFLLFTFRMSVRPSVYLPGCGNPAAQHRLTAPPHRPASPPRLTAPPHRPWGI